MIIVKMKDGNNTHFQSSFKIRQFTHHQALPSQLFSILQWLLNLSLEHLLDVDWKHSKSVILTINIKNAKQFSETWNLVRMYAVSAVCWSENNHSRKTESQWRLKQAIEPKDGAWWCILGDWRRMVTGEQAADGWKLASYYWQEVANGVLQATDS